MKLPFDPGAAAPPGSGIFGLPFTPEDSRIVLIPVPFEATTSYGGGASRGPTAILEASKQVDLYDFETGRPYESGIAMIGESSFIKKLNASAKRAAKPVIAAGGASTHKLQQSAAQVNAACEEMNRHVQKEAARWMSKDKIVGIVGGDHSTPFGAIAACANRHEHLGILHFDAHADLRVAYEGFEWSHASIMYNVASRIHNISRIVQVGIRDFSEDEKNYIDRSNGRIVTYFAPEIFRRRFEGETWNGIVKEIVSMLPADVYVSFDIDGLDPTLCPHTGTPVAGGLQFFEATAILAEIVKSGRRIVAFDLNEVAPGPDDEWDANVGARILYKLAGFALKSQNGPQSQRP